MISGLSDVFHFYSALTLLHGFFILGVQFFPLYFAVYLVHYSNTTESKRVVIELCNMDNLIVSRVQR